MDPTGNSLGVTGQTNLSVTSNVPGANGFSQAKTEDFNITVTMPTDLACTGGSTGNICTIRCRNNALAGPFGGCFAVQQVDTTPSQNSANTISTAQTLEGIQAQVQQNQIDLPAAVAANQNAGTGEAVQGLAAVNNLLGLTLTSKAAAVQTVAVENNNAAAVVAAPSATAKVGKAGKATAAAAPAADATTSTAATKKGKGNNNNDRRDGGLKWAKGAMDVGSQE